MADDIVTKPCTKCQRVLPLDNFRTQSHNRDLRQGVCRRCEADQCKVYRAQNLDYWRKVCRENARKPEHIEKGLKRYKSVPKEEWAKRAREKRATWGEVEKAKKREIARNWGKKNPDALKALAHRRRALKIGAQGSHTKEDLTAIRIAQKDKCAYCAVALNGRGSLDHIMPLVLGGGNDPKNLQFTCKSCNSAKGAKHPDEFAKIFAKRTAGDYS